MKFKNDQTLKNKLILQHQTKQAELLEVKRETYYKKLREAFPEIDILLGDLWVTIEGEIKIKIGGEEFFVKQHELNDKLCYVYLLTAETKPLNRETCVNSHELAQYWLRSKRTFWQRFYDYWADL